MPEGLTLAVLLDWLKLPADRVAVERNLEIVPRDHWPATPIHVGDRLEVVHFVGGGALDGETDDGQRLMADRESAVVY